MWSKSLVCLLLVISFMLKRIFYKRNELQEVEFFEDIECKVPFNFEDVKNIYIELKDGDLSPLIYLADVSFYYNNPSSVYAKNLCYCISSPP